MDFYAFLQNQMEDWKKTSSFRELKTPLPSSDYIDFSSNDYLGLNADKELKERFLKSQEQLSYSASSSRLISGNHSDYSAMEDYLSTLYQGRAALFFNSGFHLNIGVLPAISQKNDLILADKLVHASLIDGLRLSTAKVIRYPHLDYKKLEYLLQKHRSNYRHIFIVSESVFSMTGEMVDLSRLVTLKQKYEALLYLDEAHSVGVIGKNGLGLAEKKQLLSEVDFLVGTMGKALCSVGAYLICKEEVKAFLINKCRSLIYTTALPPINLAWSLFIMQEVVQSNAKRKHLEELSKYLRKQLQYLKFKIVGDAHIFAIVLGKNDLCMTMQSYLLEQGIVVQAIRPPTVPNNEACLRISLHSNLKFEDLDGLINALKSKVGFLYNNVNLG